MASTELALGDASSNVFSTMWSVPGPAYGLSRTVLGDWSFAAIATIQSGGALTVADTNSANVFGSAKIGRS